MMCTNPIRVFHKRKWADRPVDNPTGLLVPCGKCLLCRIKKRQEWSLRMQHELTSWEHASFITLTYDDDHLPQNGSLVKSDLQKYFKRLRKNVGVKIKYFACGEYGDQFGRPHYHAIVFGLPPVKGIFQGSWNKGLIDVGCVTPQSINYVVGYINKKYTGEDEYVYYLSVGLEPVFRILSAGIGRKYAIDNADQIINSGVTLGGVKLSYPRYYIDTLQIDTDNLKLSDEERQRRRNKRRIGVEKTDEEVYRTERAKTVTEEQVHASEYNKQRAVDAERRVARKRRAF